jgi:hypothetical protein
MRDFGCQRDGIDRKPPGRFRGALRVKDCFNTWLEQTEKVGSLEIRFAALCRDIPILDVENGT